MDVEKYAEVVLYSIGSEYRSMEDVRAAKSISTSRINRILRRSSADSLTPMVLTLLAEKGLIRVSGIVIYFLPPLIERFESGA